MDPSAIAIIGGAASAIAAHVVTAWLTRSRERETWLRQQRVDLYTQMLVWEHQAKRWAQLEPEWTGWKEGDGVMVGELGSAPLPPVPSPEFEARARLIATPDVHHAWCAALRRHDGFRMVADLDDLESPEHVASRAEFFRLLDRLVIAAQSDSTATSRGRLWKWRARLRHRRQRGAEHPG